MREIAKDAKSAKVFESQERLSTEGAEIIEC